MTLHSKSQKASRLEVGWQTLCNLTELAFAVHSNLILVMHGPTAATWAMFEKFMQDQYRQLQPACKLMKSCMSLVLTL